MTLAPATRLGPYEIVAPLGAGGMGEVYRAKDPRLGREVAIKLVLAGAAHDPDRLRRFEQEARATSALNHPNLLTVFDFGSHDGQPFLVTELLEGRTLRAALDAGESIAVRTAVDWGAQIARGLAAAHEKGIVHRDLKPENLFVTADGRVKILDFGLAKLTLGDDGTLASAATIAGGETATGMILGTAGYMAPEQVRGEKVDARADLFSLGCVLYELFGGRRAFHGETAIESLNAILKEEPRSLSELRADLPPALARLVERCLEKSPARRFQGASDFAWALESAGTAGSGASSAAARIAEPAPRRRQLAAAALVAGGALAGALGLAVLRGTPGAHPPAWSGELMVGGSVLAYGARESPDGSTIAFLVLDETRQSQVAVMRPGERRWTQLTHDRSSGPVLSVAWSSDGRLLYLQRAVPIQIRSVPLLGGDERLVVEDASQPQPLPDGSLLFERRSKSNTVRVFRHWPADARTTPIGPEFVELTSPGPGGRLASFDDGKEALYFGLRVEDVGQRGPGLWVIDLASGAARPLAPELGFSDAEESIVLPAVAVDPLRDEALVAVRRGDLHVVTAIPRSGRGAPRPIVPVTAPPWFIDVGADGALYVDQIEVAGSLLRFGTDGGTPDTVAHFAGSPGRSTGPLELPGGVLFSTVQSGRSTLLLATAQGTSPFVETGEETSGPAVLLDAERVVFLIGPAASRELAIASLDGRIIRRLPAPGAGVPTALSSFGDGKRLLWGAQGKLFVFDVTSGETRAVADADSGTIDPSTGDLLVKGSESDRSRIRRIGLDGSARADYGSHPELFLYSWSGPIVDRAGRLLATIGPPTSWFLGTGLSTPADRALRQIPLEFDGDVFTPSWGRDGSVLAVGWEYRANVWRFTRDDLDSAKRAGR